MKHSPEPTTLWREWALFGLKWLLLASYSAGVYLTRLETGDTDPASGLLVGFAVVAVADFLLALFLLVPYFHRALQPSIVVGDALIALAFVNLSGGAPSLVLGVLGSLMLSALLCLLPVWMLVEVAGLFAGAFVGLSLAGEEAVALLAGGELNAVLVLLAGMAGIALAGSYVIDRQVGAQARRIADLMRGGTAELQSLRERTRAIYELSSTISSTLHYEAILEAAIDAGRLGLRDHNESGFYGAVLLFRASDNALHVAASHRLTRADAAAVVRGVDGVIGDALREAVPVFATRAAKDPELQYFSAFQASRSIVCIPLRSGYDNYGVIIYGSEKPDAFDAEHAELLAAVGYQTTIALQNAVLYRSLIEEKERIVAVEEEARKQLARDLHDGPTQSVAAIAMRMSYISRLLQKQPADVPEELTKVEELARKTVKEIRHMLFTLRPLVLESQGLGAALNQLAEKMQETHGQAVAIRMGRDVEPALDKHQQGVIFYIVEEAVNNARKHAQANLITVALARQQDVIICKISDNGLGFNLGSVSANYEQRSSLGMVNMRERAALLDGQLRIDSEEGKGTTITIVFPMRGGNPVAAPNGKAARNGRPATKLALAAIQRLNKSSR